MESRLRPVHASPPSIFPPASHDSPSIISRSNILENVQTWDFLNSSSYDQTAKCFPPISFPLIQSRPGALCSTIHVLFPSVSLSSSTGNTEVYAHDLGMTWSSHQPPCSPAHQVKLGTPSSLLPTDKNLVFSQQYQLSVSSAYSQMSLRMSQFFSRWNFPNKVLKTVTTKQ